MDDFVKCVQPFEGIGVRAVIRLSGQAGAPKPLANWANEIKECFAQGKSRTLDLARIVYTARDSLPHGQWTQLFKTDCLPFSKRKVVLTTRS
jgi:hypothetical protein